MRESCTGVSCAVTAWSAMVAVLALGRAWCAEAVRTEAMLVMTEAIRTETSTEAARVAV